MRSTLLFWPLCFHLIHWPLFLYCSADLQLCYNISWELQLVVTLSGWRNYWIRGQLLHDQSKKCLILHCNHSCFPHIYLTVLTRITPWQWSDDLESSGWTIMSISDSKLKSENKVWGVLASPWLTAVFVCQPDCTNQNPTMALIIWCGLEMSISHLSLHCSGCNPADQLQKSQPQDTDCSSWCDLLDPHLWEAHCIRQGLNTRLQSLRAALSIDLLSSND